MCDDWRDWTNLLQASITAAAGLLGVAIGGWVTARTQKMERKSARIREQLMGFYAPLRGIRAEIRAKSELRVKLHSDADAAWRQVLASESDPVRKLKLEEEEWPKYDAVLKYSSEQLKSDLVPLYQRLLRQFTDQMWLAEQSTLRHYSALVEFVEIWNRHLKAPLPYDLIIRLGHEEKKIEPLYDDIEQHFRELSAQLKN
jgi:hypothetical protein